MRLPVIFLESVQSDFEAAAEYYASVRAGFESEFVADVEAALKRIGQHPLAYQVVFHNVRRCVVRRFSYAIFFRVLADRIEVLAMTDARRDPRRWRNRS